MDGALLGVSTRLRCDNSDDRRGRWFGNLNAISQLGKREHHLKHLNVRAVMNQSGCIML